LLWETETARDYVTKNGVSARGGVMEGPGPIIARGAMFEKQGELERCPRDSFAVTHCHPPCVSMIERQMARLIPMPSGLVV
jgi:hypothetical protein